MWNPYPNPQQSNQNGWCLPNPGGMTGINGHRGPLGVPNPMAGYDQSPGIRPGARGFNAGYNQQQARLMPPAQDWFGQGQAAPVQYTAPANPSYWDAFGYAASQIQYYSRGKTELNQQDVQLAFNTPSDTARQLLMSMDLDNNQNVGEQELAAFTLLSDSPAKILWNVVQANKNNPNYSNKAGLGQLEQAIRSSVPFDNSGNPMTRPADGRLDEADKALLMKAVACTPDLVKATLQELKRSLNLDASYQAYGQAVSRFENSFQAPLSLSAPICEPTQPTNLYGNTLVPGNPWRDMNWLSQMQPQQLQIMMLLLMMQVSYGAGPSSAATSMGLGNSMGNNNMGMALQLPWNVPGMMGTQGNSNTPLSMYG
jgi:hypothetical protein